MSFHVFLKVFGEVCLYFGCVGALPALFPHDLFPLLPAAVCAIPAAIAAFLSDHGRTPPRLLLSLLLLPCLLFGHSLMEWLILLPPVIYAASLIMRDEWTLEYFHFREQFRKTLTIMIITLILVHFGVLIESRSHRTHVLDSIALLQHLIIYGFCGIVLQLQLRLGTDQKRSRYLNSLQLLLVTVCTGALVLAIVAAERFLSSRGISPGQLIGYGLQIFFGVFLSVFQRLFTIVAEMIKTAKRLRLEDNASSDVDPVTVMPMEQMQQLLPDAPQEAAPFPWWLAILVLILLTGILILLSRVLRGRKPEVHHSETVRQLSPRVRQNQPSRRGNRSRLRKVYREFLKSEKRRGHRLQPWHTSLDILDDVQPGGDPEAAARLRNLYLSARYDPGSTVTAQQVQEAKDALKQYRND